MANRETQVDLTAIVVGNPAVRGTQINRTAVQGGNPNGRFSQVYMTAILPNEPNSTPPGGNLKPIMQFLMP